MTDDLDMFVTEATSDPASWVEAKVLGNPARVTALAQLKIDDRGTYEQLLLRLKSAKVANLVSLKAAVTDAANRITAAAKAVGAEERETAPTVDEVLAEMAADIDTGAADWEDTGRLLTDIVAFLRRYVRFVDPAPDDAGRQHHHQAVCCALWVAHSWAIGSFDMTGRLCIQAPQKESGKTRLLECLEVLCLRARVWVLPTSAVVYRTLDMGPSTLLLDEVDGIFRGRNADKHVDLANIINAGYSRTGVVPRMVPAGDGWELVDFPVFAPMALAGIGSILDTIQSRAFIIRLQRQRKDGRAAKFRRREVGPVAGGLRDRLTLWAAHHKDTLAASRPATAKGLTDRQEDIWEPLFSIADLAGGQWPARARAAASYLAARADDDGDNISTQLLSDIRKVFTDRDTDRVFTEVLLEDLWGLDEAPWGSWGSRRRQSGLTARDLAGMLKEFGIQSRQVRIGAITGKKGYERADFVDAWERYVPEAPSPDGLQGLQGLHPKQDGGSGVDHVGLHDGLHAAAAPDVDPGVDPDVDHVVYGQTAGQKGFVDPVDLVDPTERVGRCVTCGKPCSWKVDGRYLHAGCPEPEAAFATENLTSEKENHA